MKQTYVTVLPLALSFDPKYFHEPEAWRPERWLRDAETNPKFPHYNNHRKSIRGFGWGPYICIGEPLVWAMMRLVLAKLIFTYDLKKSDTPNSGIVWHEQEVFAIIIKHRLEVTLAERTG
jgi:cytochrome P450